MRKRGLIDFIVGLLVGSFVTATVVVSFMLYDQQVSRFKMQEAEERATRADQWTKAADERARTADEEAREAKGQFEAQLKAWKERQRDDKRRVGPAPLEPIQP
jgi:hypothetical protein